MINKSIYYILAFLYIATGCNSPTGSDTEVGKFYPMEIGNQWEYNTNSSSQIEKVIDTLRIQEKLYYGFTK